MDKKIAAVRQALCVTKIIKEDNVPCKIEEGLYLGSLGAANDKPRLKSLNITHILTVANGLAPAHPNDFTYKVISVPDREHVEISQYFDECFNFIEEGKRVGGVLVHCYKGRSRSVTAVVSYLMKKHGTGMSEVLELVKSKRPLACPNAGFMLQLQNYEKFLRDMKLTDLAPANEAMPAALPKLSIAKKRKTHVAETTDASPPASKTTHMVSVGVEVTPVHFSSGEENLSLTRTRRSRKDKHVPGSNFDYRPLLDALFNGANDLSSMFSQLGSALRPEDWISPNSIDKVAGAGLFQFISFGRTLAELYHRARSNQEAAILESNRTRDRDDKIAELEAEVCDCHGKIAELEAVLSDPKALVTRLLSTKEAAIPFYEAMLENEVGDELVSETAAWALKKGRYSMLTEVKGRLAQCFDGEEYAEIKKGLPDGVEDPGLPPYVKVPTSGIGTSGPNGEETA